MSFNLAMFQPESLTKADNGASAVAPGEPGAGRPVPAAGRAASGGYQPDPAVTDRRGGVHPGRPADTLQMRSSTGTAPGEPVTEQVVPALTKAVPPGWTNGGRTAAGRRRWATTRSTATRQGRPAAAPRP
jgi:hypothetical protein